MSSVAINEARTGRRNGPSIMDVARLAGVSGQTVSRVSNQPELVKPATRERVLHAMEKLGYSPNRAARALRDGVYGSIGLLAHRFDRTGEAMTTDAVLRAAETRDLSVTLVSVHEPESEGWAPAAKRLQHQTVDGLIILRSEGDSTEPLALPPRFPVVVSDSRENGQYPSVINDEPIGVRAAVDHLLDLGHRTVHHISGPTDSEPARVRATAWRNRLVAKGVPVVEPIVGDWTADAGYRIGQQIADDPEVTAVLCANDHTAFGLLHALHERGIDVPGDVSVIGFDGISLAAHATPPLTTVRQDFTTMGTELVHLLVDQMNGATTRKHPHVAVPTELVVRESTGPMRRR